MRLATALFLRPLRSAYLPHEFLKAWVAAQVGKMWVPADSGNVTHVFLAGSLEP